MGTQEKQEAEGWAELLVADADYRLTARIPQEARDALTRILAFEQADLARREIARLQVEAEGRIDEIVERARVEAAEQFAHWQETAVATVMRDLQAAREERRRARADAMRIRQRAIEQRPWTSS